MKRIKQIVSALLLVGFISTATVSGFHVFQHFDGVRTGLPIEVLKWHRGVSNLIQSLGNLTERLGVAQFDPTPANLNQLIIALDTVIVVDQGLNTGLEVQKRMGTRAVRQELTTMLEVVEALVEGLTFDTEAAQRQQIRLIYLSNELKSAYLKGNQQTVAQLSVQSNLLATLKEETMMLLGLIVLAIGIIFVFLIQASRVNVMLSATQSDLSKAKSAAESANQAKSEFLSSMSHELRTPLNAILGFAQLLVFNPKEPLSQNQKQSVEHITKGGKHLLELINAVLDLAQIESGKLDLSIVDIDAMILINECMPMAETLAEQRGITIEVNGDPGKVVRADDTRLKQVLLNLISNAVKYNREAGTVSVKSTVEANSMLRISVTDTGQGISSKNQESLFKPFSRLGAEETEIEGTGIGLVITKRLIEAMGGRIGFESVLGKGSTFWIETPLSEALSTEEGEAKNADEITIPDVPVIFGKVVYIEDSPENIALMQLLLSRIEGINLQVAHNAEMGLALVKLEKPNLILMDINLPGMNGIEALGVLRADPETRDIPIIAISAAAMPDDIAKGLNAGFYAYLTKPFNIPEVLEAIKGVLKT